MTASTTKTPTEKPALKISPISSQLLNETARKNSKDGKRNFCILVDFVLVKQLSSHRILQLIFFFSWVNKSPFFKLVVSVEDILVKSYLVTCGCKFITGAVPYNKTIYSRRLQPGNAAHQ